MKFFLYYIACTAVWESLSHTTFCNINIKVLVDIFDSGFLSMGDGLAAKEVKLGSWAWMLKCVLVYSIQ